MPHTRLRPRTPHAVAGPLLVLSLLLLASPAAAAATWVWPLTGPHSVSRPFSPGPAPWSAGHRGADLPAAPGAVVLAAGAGRVAYAGLLAGRGVLVLEHGSLRTTYEPVTPTVRVGQAVAAGDPVGTLDPGHPGCPAPACLHWGLRRGEDYLDPVRLVERGPVRLLPAAGPVQRPAAGPLVAATAAGPPAGPDRGRRAAARDGGPDPGPGPGRRAAAVTTGAALLLGAAAAGRRRRLLEPAAAGPGPGKGELAVVDAT